MWGGCDGGSITQPAGTTTFPSCGTQTIPGPISVGGGSDGAVYAHAVARAPCTQYCEDNTKIGSIGITGDPAYGANSALYSGSERTLLETDPNNQGFCSPPSGAAAIEENECYSKLTSTDCNSQANNCSWKSFKDYLRIDQHLIKDRTKKEQKSSKSRPTKIPQTCFEL